MAQRGTGVSRARERAIERLEALTGAAHRIGVAMARAPAPENLTGENQPAQASLAGLEAEAVRISENIRAAHMPHGTLMDPLFDSPAGGNIVSYTRAADSAIWTGHYLAAEAFRYKVTQDPIALDHLKFTLNGINRLAAAPGTGLLARAVVPLDSPYAAAIRSEEAGHGIFEANLDGEPVFWIGNTSRDQYCGVFFGLCAAFDMVENEEVRETIRDLVTRLLAFLLENNWVVAMPGGGFSTVFIGRADQQLALTQVGRHVNPDRFTADYDTLQLLSPFVIIPIAFEVLDDHNSYFKFNLAVINLYHLVGLESGKRLRKVYRSAYNVLRRTIDDHGNAHFNMIDRALSGPNESRDAETAGLLAAWLGRPRRDEFVDLRGALPFCGQPDRACAPIPVPDRVRTDFLWQRSPFLLFGGGEGKIETAGVDFILPYWMARYYSVG